MCHWTASIAERLLIMLKPVKSYSDAWSNVTWQLNTEPSDKLQTKPDACDNLPTPIQLDVDLRACVPEAYIVYGYL